MTMQSLYEIEAGELTGQRMSGSAELVALNTPPGHAWVQGAHDPRRAVVRLVTDDFGVQQPIVQPRPPPRPADTAYQTWSWDEAADDWVAAPTLLLQQAQARAPVLTQLADLDTKLARPVGEIAEAQALGETLPAAAVQRLQSINANKQALRAHMAAIDAAATQEALALLLASRPTLQTTGG